MKKFSSCYLFTYCLTDKTAGLNVNKEKLKNIYCSIVRSVIEYSSVIYGLAKYQAKKLEDIQKRCLKTMFGYDKSYEELLQLSNLKTLEERRCDSLIKFEKNCN